MPEDWRKWGAAVATSQACSLGLPRLTVKDKHSKTLDIRRQIKITEGWKKL